MKFLQKIWLAALLFSCLALLSSSQISAAANDVTISVSQTAGNLGHLGSGFLLTPTTPDLDTQYLNPIAPQFYRTQEPQITDQSNYQRMKNLGARVQFVTYANYFDNYASKGIWPGDNNDWTTWENSLTQTVNKIKAQNLQVEYEIWNEPDTTFFWGRDKARFFELWKRSYQIIKNLDPQAVIVGPAQAVFNEAYLKDFLTFAKANNVVPDILSWHE